MAPRVSNKKIPKNQPKKCLAVFPQLRLSMKRRLALRTLIVLLFSQVNNKEEYALRQCIKSMDKESTPFQ